MKIVDFKTCEGTGRTVQETGETIQVLGKMAKDGNQNKYTPYAALSFPLSKTLPQSVRVSG